MQGEGGVGPMVPSAVRCACLVGALAGWVVAVWMVAAGAPGGGGVRSLVLAAAAVLSVIAGIGYAVQGYDGAYRMGYRIGWDEGRAAERLVARSGGVVPFPVRRHPNA